MSRSFWYKHKLYASNAPDPDGVVPVPTDEKHANLVSSLDEGGGVNWHLPALDIDYEAELVESSSPGHYHLYLNTSVPWDKYKAVLVALADAGLIQQGFADASIRYGMTFLRKPGIKKGDDRSDAEREAAESEVRTFIPKEIPF